MFVYMLIVDDFDVGINKVFIYVGNLFEGKFVINVKIGVIIIIGKLDYEK